ncbi:MAG: hypothetical protein IKN46_01620 [Acholeplasmatales bacterium]|nr:hypothetical protein [Acholeplasmatales bacterium]
MSIGKIDFIANHKVDNNLTYFKGEVIKIPELKEDTHMANVIYDEIRKGVYI